MLNFIDTKSVRMHVSASNNVISVRTGVCLDDFIKKGKVDVFNKNGMSGIG